MTKNKLTDLNDHLFAQMERLSDESLTPDQIDAEVKRAAAMVGVADQISGNAELQLKAAKLFADHGSSVLPMLPQIGGTKATSET
ncbi:hypothetical protein EU805_01635 [Salipiger sp. IMCC34102]|uniref:hypothetical protein n=1 Tax=Salipiger sp. IMCC34102 TaxID=2510647 RepID=UPI00101C910B|nr:hypothetical protein [Salipiger sp. IMCC34102]RYH04099.1 hypothetical protein EU805_01635 [Salipiger sp. IMCC34102]